MFKSHHKTAATLSVMTMLTCMSVERLARAETDSPKKLTHQLEVLTRTVEELTRRIDSLEQKLEQIEGRQQTERSASEGTRAPAQPPAATAGVPKEQAQGLSKNAPVAAKAAPAGEETAKLTPPESWARLKEGMTQAQVTDLLGMPNTAFKLSGQTVWYYYYRDIGAGSVFFYDDGHVASQQKPPFSGWHW